jgi:hypothetical protein
MYTKLLFEGCETWSLTIKEEHKLRAFDIKVPRRIEGRSYRKMGKFT